MSDIFLFIDTEFTSFENPQLISIALAHTEYDSIYRESSEYDLSACSHFVDTTVLPLLEHIGIPEVQITQDIYSYLQTLKSQNPLSKIYIVGDYAGDWTIFSKLMSSLGNKATWGVDGFINLYSYLHYAVHRDVADDAMARATLESIHRYYTETQASWFIAQGKLEHHALSDARANCYAFYQSVDHIQQQAQLTLAA